MTALGGKSLNLAIRQEVVNDSGNDRPQDQVLDFGDRIVGLQPEVKWVIFRDLGLREVILAIFLLTGKMVKNEIFEHLDSQIPASPGIKWGSAKIAKMRFSRIKAFY